MQTHDFLVEQHVAFETLIAPPAFTAQRRAEHLHVSGHRVAKAVLLVGPNGPFVAVLPATHHVDTGRLARHLGGPIRLASETEIAEVFLDCEWGLVPPFGARYGLPTVLDEAIAREDLVVFEANFRGLAIRMRGADFERLEHPQRFAFACEARAMPNARPL